MENTKDNKSSVLNVTIQDTKYRFEGNVTYCDMVVKVNLNNFENQFYHFTPDFVKKTVSEHLPIVKSVINYGYSDLEPVVAKYYILPGGPAKVLAFNYKYYQRYHGLDSSELPKVGDLIPVKKMPKTDTSRNFGHSAQSEFAQECIQYDYCQTFSVTGKAVCLPEDQFDEERGKAIATQKAVAKSAKRINRLYAAILDRTQSMLDEIHDQHSQTVNWMEQAEKIQKQLNSLDTENIG